MVDVTDKYCDMIDRFCCDFSLARDMCSDFTLYITMHKIKVLREQECKFGMNLSIP